MALSRGGWWPDSLSGISTTLSPLLQGCYPRCTGGLSLLISGLAFLCLCDSSRFRTEFLNFEAPGWVSMLGEFDAFFFFGKSSTASNTLPKGSARNL